MSINNSPLFCNKSLPFSLLILLQALQIATMILFGLLLLKLNMEKMIGNFAYSTVSEKTIFEKVGT